MISCFPLVCAPQGVIDTFKRLRPIPEKMFRSSPKQIHPIFRVAGRALSLALLRPWKRIRFRNI